MNLKLQPDPETQKRLIEAAVAERRPIVMQAEILLRRALGLPELIYAPDQRARSQRREVAGAA